MGWIEKIEAHQHDMPQYYIPSTTPKKERPKPGDQWQCSCAAYFVMNYGRPEWDLQPFVWREFTPKFAT